MRTLDIEHELWQNTTINQEYNKYKGSGGGGGGGGNRNGGGGIK